jgi:hypothetical protein
MCRVIEPVTLNKHLFSANYETCYDIVAVSKARVQAETFYSTVTGLGGVGSAGGGCGVDYLQVSPNEVRSTAQAGVCSS